MGHKTNYISFQPLAMGILTDIFGNGGGGGTPPSDQSHDRFPDDEYGPAYAVTVYREDITAVRNLVDTERDTPRMGSRFMQEVLEDANNPMQGSLEDLAADIREMMDVWERQMETDPSAVWWPVGADTQFELYLSYCDERAELEQDPFERPSSMGRVQSVVDRCLTAQESDANLAVVPNEYIPLQSSEDEGA